jgi:hypothetical protein
MPRSARNRFYIGIETCCNDVGVRKKARVGVWVDKWLLAERACVASVKSRRASGASGVAASSAN